MKRCLKKAAFYIGFLSAFPLRGRGTVLFHKTVDEVENPSKSPSKKNQKETDT